MSDPINSPAHYTFGKIEVIDVLEEWFPADPLLWQVGKYIARAGRKGRRLRTWKRRRDICGAGLKRKRRSRLPLQ